MAAPCYFMDYAGRFDFPVDPPELWEALQRIDQFERWWGWLGNLEVEGDGLQEGSVLHGTVAPPVPYRMHVDVELCQCVPERLIDASVSGDLRGEAHLRMHPCARGTAAEVAWSLEMLQLPMRLAARVAYPLLRWGHDCVVDATVRGFRSQLRPDQR